MTLITNNLFTNQLKSKCFIIGTKLNKRFDSVFTKHGLKLKLEKLDIFYLIKFELNIFTKLSPAHISCKLPGLTTNKLLKEYKTLNNLSTIGLLKFLAHNLYSLMSLIKAIAPFVICF